jgi:hypothetical protein
MIGHETVRPYLDSGLARLLGQQISINLLIAILKKDRLPTIPTLPNVMRKAGMDERANRAMVKIDTNAGTGDRHHPPIL